MVQETKTKELIVKVTQYKDLLVKVKKNSSDYRQENLTPDLEPLKKNRRKENLTQDPKKRKVMTTRTAIHTNSDSNNQTNRRPPHQRTERKTDELHTRTALIQEPLTQNKAV